ncbi:MAG: hypothetical protein RLZZ383_2163 [Pseudomonadota bacterium]|jgi:hypothetical protein
MTHDAGSLWDPDRLDRAAAALVARGAWRPAVALVERFAREATPRPSTWLHEAIAFYHLGLMDRCASRLQQAVGDGVDAQAHAHWTARMLLARGWRGRAAQGLDAWLHLHPDDEEARSLRARAEEPAARAPQSDPPAGSTPDELLDAARQCLHAGAFLRGRRLLERALAHAESSAAGGPERDARALDLMWALDTDLARPGSPAQALLDAEAWIALDGQRGPLWPHGEVAAAPTAQRLAPPVVFPELFDEDDDGDPNTAPTSDTEPTVPNGGVPAPVPSPFVEETRIQTVHVTRAEVEADAATPPVAVAVVDWEDEAVVALRTDALDAPPPTVVKPSDADLLVLAASPPSAAASVATTPSSPSPGADDDRPDAAPSNIGSPDVGPGASAPLSRAVTVAALVIGLLLLAVSFFVAP